MGPYPRLQPHVSQVSTTGHGPFVAQCERHSLGFELEVATVDPITLSNPNPNPLTLNPNPNPYPYPNPDPKPYPNLNLDQVAAVDATQAQFVVRLQLSRGDPWLFKELCARLLPAIRT